MKIAFISRGHFFQTIILSTKNPMLSSKLNVLFHNSIHKLSDVKNTFMSRGHFFQTIVLSINNPMLSSKLNIRTQNSVLSCQMWKIPSQTGIAFMRQSFWVQTTLCYLQNWMFCPITLFQVVRFEKTPSQAGVVGLQKLFWVSTILCYLQNWTFHVIFLFISIVFALSLHKPHFLLFKCNFDSLEWKFGTYSFM